MPSIRINKDLSNEPHFITLTIKRWYYLFDRFQRWDILADSLIYCQKNKGLKIYGYVFMLNHIHLLIQAPNLINIVRDFKKFTSKKIYQNIELNEKNILELFIDKNREYEFWQKTNMPEYIYSENFFNQKMEYIHNNPVKKQYVSLPESWYWSSASHYFKNEGGPIKIDSYAI